MRARLAHSHRTQAWAVLDYYNPTPPALADWAAWLGGMTTQQVCNTRLALHARGIIRYVEGDPMRVAFNPEWETWQPTVFDGHQKRQGAGRKPPSKFPNVEPVALNQPAYRDY